MDQTLDLVIHFTDGQAQLAITVPRQSAEDLLKWFRTAQSSDVRNLVLAGAAQYFIQKQNVAMIAVTRGEVADA